MSRNTRGRITTAVAVAIASTAALGGVAHGQASSDPTDGDAAPIASVAPDVFASAAAAAQDSTPATLRADGGAFTSAGTDRPVSIDAQPQDGARVQSTGGALTFTPLGVDAGAADGVLVGDATVLYGDVAPASDLAIRPTEQGLETFTGLRDASAPTAFRFKIGLPDGQRLVKLASGGVAILQVQHDSGADSTGQADSGGATDPAWATELPAEPLADDIAPKQPDEKVTSEKVVAEIPPTWAVDADGSPVATKLSVDGDVVTLDVDHHADGVSYPVVADPQIQTTPASGQTTSSTSSASLPTWQNTYDWTLSSPHGYFGWNSQTSSTDPGAYTFARGLPAGAGLWVWPTGGRTYSPGYANWAYNAPGTTRALTATVTLSYPPRLLSHHCVAVALRDKDGNERNASRFCKPPQPPKGNPATVTLAIADPTPSAPASTQLTVGLELPCTKSNASACNKNIPSADASQDGLRVLKVDMSLVDDDLPVPAPSGEWYDLRDNYVNGQKAHALTLAASDAGSGVKRVAVEEVGKGELASSNAPCDLTHKTAALDNRICPASYSAPATIDATKLPEGKHLFRETAQDLAGNTGASAPWAVSVDRTGPAKVTGVAGDFDPDLKQLEVSWPAAADPALADGTPSSGTTSYSYRFRRTGQDWSAWSTTPFAGFTLADVQEGERVNVEVRPQDAVGNQGATDSEDVVANRPATWDCSEQPMGAYPSSCVADSEPPADAGDAGDPNAPNVSYEPLQQASARSSGTPVNQRFRVKVRTKLGDIYTQPFERWSTMRSAPNSWVIGQAPDGAVFDAEYKDDAQNSAGQRVNWYRGLVDGSTSGPDRGGCGFVINTNLAEAPSIGDFGRCGGLAERGMTIQRFSSYTNCPHVDADTKNNKCNRGTAIGLVAPSRVCANIGLNQNGNSTGCGIDGPNYLGQLNRGACIEWRYITRDGGDRNQQWVLGKLRSRKNPEASWVFIRRTALKAQTSQLPSISTPRDQSCNN